MGDVERTAAAERVTAELRRATEGGKYREVPATVALDVICNTSEWAWRAFGELNRWDAVRGFHWGHFRELALDDHLKVTGIGARSGKREQIPKDRWRDVQLSELVSHTYGVQTELIRSRAFGEFDRHYHLLVSEYDVELIPRASVLLRINSQMRVWVRLAHWWLLPPGIRDNVRE